MDKEFLQLTNNALEGALPTELGNLANLSKLGVGVARKLLPRCGSKLILKFVPIVPIVAVLGLGRNLFNGTLPSELGLLNSLGMLCFWGQYPTFVPGS